MGDHLIRGPSRRPKRWPPRPSPSSIATGASTPGRRGGCPLGCARDASPAFETPRRFAPSPSGSGSGFRRSSAPTAPGSSRSHEGMGRNRYGCSARSDAGARTREATSTSSWMRFPGRPCWTARTSRSSSTGCWDDPSTSSRRRPFPGRCGPRFWPRRSRCEGGGGPSWGAGGPHAARSGGGRAILRPGPAAVLRPALSGAPGRCRAQDPSFRGDRDEGRTRLQERESPPTVARARPVAQRPRPGVPRGQGGDGLAILER